MLSFKIEKDGKKWHSFCPELQGCHSFGNTQEEALKNLKNAVQLYIEDEIEQQSFHSFVGTTKHVTHA